MSGLGPRTWRVVLITALAVPAWCAVAAAQEASAADKSFARMRDKLNAGDRVTVTVADGRVLKGQFSDVSEQALTVSTASGSQQFAARDVVRVQRHRRGFLLGTIVGAGVGIGCGVALASWFENEGSGNEVSAVLGMTALGAGIGFGVDALVNFPRTVYRQPDRGSALRIEARPGRAAVHWTVAF